MFYGAKLENCFETVIAVMAAHIERMEIDAEMKDQANARLREENMALEAECTRQRERAAKLDEQLGKIKAFCDNEISEAATKNKALYMLRSRPAEFIKQTEAAKKVEEAVRKHLLVDSDHDPFDPDKEI